LTINNDGNGLSMSGNLNILVVDDEEIILNVFRDYLETVGGYNVFTTTDGFEALEVIKGEKIDCCFIDLAMPIMDGLELIKRIYLHDNALPVVVMTGYPSMDNAIKTLKNGVVDYLTKPIKMEQVPPTIERVMRERSLFVDNILLKEEAKKNKELLKINQELQWKLKEVETINLILQQLDQATTSKDLFTVLVNLTGEVTHCDEAHFCVHSQEMKNPAAITSFFRDESSSASSTLLQHTAIEEVAHGEIPYIIHGADGKPNIMAVPLKIRSNTFGTLISLMRNGGHRFSEKDLYFLHFLAEKASFLIENLALYENIYENLFSTLYAFVETIEARDPYTRQHSARVTNYAISIAKALGCSQEEIEMLNVSGNLHDIGKIGIPDIILLKPDRLTESEYEAIKKHPDIGSSIIGHFDMWSQEQQIIRHHHERWDGNGYPDGLQGEEIPLLARILSVADVYDALTSDRSYRKRLEDEIAVEIIEENAGTQFDESIVDTFLMLYKQGEIQSSSNHQGLAA
jgi:response regulator RpfG family c-di-GMP phosphodiesterase